MWGVKLCHCGLVLTSNIHCSCAGKTLHQLTYTDSPLLKECCLYKLAFKPCLELFKWVVLIASPQVRSAADSPIRAASKRGDSMCPGEGRPLYCILPRRHWQAPVGCMSATPYDTTQILPHTLCVSACCTRTTITTYVLCHM